MREREGDRGRQTETDRHTDRERERQRETDRQTDRQIERQRMKGTIFLKVK